MTKQEEIREDGGGAQTIRQHLYSIASAYATRYAIKHGLKLQELSEPPDITEDILSYLHSQGVVIKVDRELPEECRCCFYTDDLGNKIKGIHELAGYVAVESLIGEAR